MENSRNHKSGIMEQMLTSIENHQGAAVCVAIFIVVVLGEIISIIETFRNR
jgi:hypothetical protein